jgi:hypothetical protein
MPDYTTEVRTFVGPNKYQGFIEGQVYELRFLALADGTVSIALDHLPGFREPLVVEDRLFELWWLAKRPWVDGADGARA